jgi:hypothetical protein
MGQNQQGGGKHNLVLAAFSAASGHTGCDELRVGLDPWWWVKVISKSVRASAAIGLDADAGKNRLGRRRCVRVAGAVIAPV